MFFDESTERAILHNSTDRTPQYGNKALIKKTIRKVGGSNHGVKELKKNDDDKAPKTKKQPTKWQQLIKEVMKSKGLSMKEAIKHIKENNLY